MKLSSTARNLYGISAVICLVAVWWVAAALINLPLILPAPGTVFRQTLMLIGSGDFWRHLGATLGRGLTGFGISLTGGLLVGFLAGRLDSFNAFLRPMIILVRGTPSMSIILLALIWFKGETVPLFVIFLVVFPIIVQNVIEGMRNIDRNLLEMAQVYQIPKNRQILNLYLPSILPYLTAGVASGLGITWKVVIAAEVLAYPRWGIGARMDTARVYLQTELVFAWTLVVVLLGLIFDYLAAYLLQRPFAAWKGSSHE